MLLSNNNPPSKGIIDEIKKELLAKSERFSNSDDNEYEVMHSPYANGEKAFRCSNQVMAKKLSNPPVSAPQVQFKRINLVALPSQGVNRHPTNKQVISKEKALSKDQSALSKEKALSKDWQSRSFRSGSVKKPNTNLDLLTDLSKSQEIQKKNGLSGDGMFAKQKDFKGDYYYFDDNQKKQHVKVSENTLSKLVNINKHINSPLLLKRTVSFKETESIPVQHIVPRRPAPPPPSHINARTPINNYYNSGPKIIEKKGKEPKLVPNNNIFEDFRQDSKFSKHATQLRANFYEYLS